MAYLKLSSSVALCSLLAACGGGSTGSVDSNGISTSPLSGPELETVLSGVASEAGAGSLASIVEFDPNGLDDALDGIAPRDVTVPGQANYEGVVLLLDIDPDLFDDEEVVFVEEEDLPFDPTYAVLGRSVMNVTFGSTPAISGGANGFIGLNIAAAEAAVETINIADFDPEAGFNASDIIDALPTVNVAGALTYSNAQILASDPDFPEDDNLALQFDVDGNLTLSPQLTGQNSTQNLTIDGSGIAGFTDSFAGGAMELETSGEAPIGGLFLGVTGQ